MAAKHKATAKRVTKGLVDKGHPISDEDAFEALMADLLQADEGLGDDDPEAF